jgi:23S rRNA pseudouridine1911/1915/1917 synthase
LIERWQVDPERAGERLDRLVARRYGVARNQAQNWIREARVEVDGQWRRGSYAVHEGEEISCSPRPKATADNLLPEPAALPLLYVDDDLIVIDKPPGLAVHPGAGRPTGTLVNHLLAVYPELGSVGGNDRPGIVHRLDIGTSGVLLVARTERAYQELSRAFSARRVVKRYLGVAFGEPEPAAGRIDQPLGRHPTRRKEMTVRADGREARTGYRLLARGEGVSLLELDLETGRTHQIRVHLKAIGHPLVGDQTYAGNRWRGAPRGVQRLLAGFPRPALHAATLELAHPRTGALMRFAAPLPLDIVELWRGLSPAALPELT